MKNRSKVLLFVGLLVISIAVAGCSLFPQEETKQQTNDSPVTEAKQKQEKIYVGLEEDGAVAVLDTQSRKLIKKISLDSEEGQEFMAHNVQVAPDKKSVWVTANAMEKSMHSLRLIPSAYASEMGEEKKGNSEKDNSEVIVIDPLTDSILNRVSLGTGLELAHVTLTPDSKTAIVTSQKKDTVFIIDATTKEITKKITVDASSEPHGVSVAPDGSKAYVALLKGKGILEINLSNFESMPILMDGGAAQAIVTPDGKKVVATLYDTKKVAIYNLADKKIQEISLPDGAKGPLQLYPTSDSSAVYVTDQGYYFKQPKGDKVYKVDLQNAKVVAEITVGQAPHGVVISKDGAYVFVTNYSSNDVSIIDANSNTEITKIRVGKGPNGISLWSE
ncbi:MAG: YncE family protein [Patescibacteria group bacterium]